MQRRPMLAPAARPADTEAVNEVLELAYQGIGGKLSLMNMAGFSAVSTRDRYVMGMGIEPGGGPLQVGLVRSAYLLRPQWRAAAPGFQARQSLRIDR